MGAQKQPDDVFNADEEDSNKLGAAYAHARMLWETFLRERLGIGTEDAVADKKLQEITAIMQTFGFGMEEDDQEKDRLWVDRSNFDIAICSMVMLNACTVGLEADLRGETLPRHPGWVCIEVFFLIIWTAEIGLKCYYHSWRWIYGSFSNLLITAVWGLAFAECCILNPLGVSGVLRMFSLIRVTGLSRLYRVIKKPGRADELRLLLQSLKGSAQTMFWTIVMLTTLNYVFAVILTQQIGHNVDTYYEYRKTSGGWDHEQLFGTVGRSMFTLTQIMTLDSWLSKIGRHVVVNQWYMILPLCFFVLMTTFGVMNILVSVIVEQTMQTSMQNKKKQMARKEKGHQRELDSIIDIFQISDTDGSGSLDLEEYMAAIENPEVQWRLKMLDLPLEETMMLFQKVDGDGQQELSYQDFIQGCLKLKGVAQSKDMLSVMSQADALAVKMDAMADQIGESERMMAGLDEITKRITRRFGSSIVGSRRRVAHAAGGAKPMIPPKREGVAGDGVPLSSGNRPILPAFPDLLK
eukprot:TRINITY_DN14867_c0_g2_i1.p1 TRINITY_DN14867_c0_g2~~TRINITY_DN14867_c0_g2_i1.p1  ORF type:complete len:522 (+),score=93.66 TRINITY_DN14867_c0_g2_i1:212-1777(+)